MTLVNVNLQIEAKDAADAQKKIEAMKLPEGTKVYATMQQEVGPEGMNETDAKGKLVASGPPPPETPE